MNKMKMISCHKGMAPISFPAEWLKGFDMAKSFASVNGEGRIKFPNGRAFGVSVEHNGPNVLPIVRTLSADEIKNTGWQGFCPPWEPYKKSKIFGHGPVTKLA